MSTGKAGDAASKPALRRDAQRNLEKLTAAAVDVFRERGLDAPLEEIAQRAGVSTGTLYNRFGSREALIDAVVPGLVAARLDAVAARAHACADPWQGFAQYVTELSELQATDPALNDVVSRRFPEAEQLLALCTGQVDHGRQIIERAQRAGTLRPDFTPDDLPLVFWSTQGLVRATAGVAPDAWRRAIGFILDGLRTGAAHPLPVAPLTPDQVHEAMLQLGERKPR